MSLGKERARREIGPAQQYRSSLVAKLAEIDTPAALERQLGIEVVDAETLAQRGIGQATGVMQNVIGIQRPEIPAPVAMDPTDRALEELGYGQEPLPGFAGPQPPMPPIDNRDNYRVAA